MKLRVGVLYSDRDVNGGNVIRNPRRGTLPRDHLSKPSMIILKKKH